MVSVPIAATLSSRVHSNDTWACGGLMQVIELCRLHAFANWARHHGFSNLYMVSVPIAATLSSRVHSNDTWACGGLMQVIELCRLHAFANWARHKPLNQTQSFAFNVCHVFGL